MTRIGLQRTMKAQQELELFAIFLFFFAQQQPNGELPKVSGHFCITYLNFQNKYANSESNLMYFLSNKSFAIKIFDENVRPIDNVEDKIKERDQNLAHAFHLKYIVVI